MAAKKRNGKYLYSFSMPLLLVISSIFIQMQSIWTSFQFLASSNCQNIKNADSLKKSFYQAWVTLFCPLIPEFCLCFSLATSGLMGTQAKIHIDITYKQLGPEFLRNHNCPKKTIMWARYGWLWITQASGYENNSMDKRKTFTLSMWAQISLKCLVCLHFCPVVLLV